MTTGDIGGGPPPFPKHPIPPPPRPPPHLCVPPHLSQVDENPDLDNLDIVSQDAEERYFDEEEPSDAPQLE